MCRYKINNGFSVVCDKCSRCFGLTNSDETREINFWCRKCEAWSTAEIEFARRAMGENSAAMEGLVAVAGVDGAEEVVSGKGEREVQGRSR